MASNSKLQKGEMLPPSFESHPAFPLRATLVISLLGIVSGAALEVFKVEEHAKGLVLKYVKPTSPTALGLFGGLFLLKIIHWMFFQVIRARVTHQVPWPNAYATKEMTSTFTEFNCIMRAHLNSLEGLGSYLFTMLLALQHAPYLTGVLAVLYAFSRLLYAFGYMSGNAKGRVIGFGGFIVLAMLEGLGFVYIIKQLGLWTN